MELLELCYKRCVGTAQASDYVEWANHTLYLDVSEINKLASLSIEQSFNLFEIEGMFDKALKAAQIEAPSKELCLHNHIRNLHAQLLLPVQDAMLIVKEIYDCAISNGVFEEQLNWQEMNDVIDDFQHGANFNGYTTDVVNEMIIAHARRLWHTKGSKIHFKQLIGQKVTAIDSEIHFIIQLEKGAVVIECPWRIRNKDGILIGETDIQSNQKEWITIGDLLIDHTIGDVQLFEQCPFLIIQFGSLFLDVFHASSYFDGWTLTDEEDFYIFSMHGGSIVESV